MLLVVGMQNDKISAMAWGGEGASLRGQTVPTASVDALRGEVNRCIEFATAAGWKIAFVLDLHHPMHCSFEGHGGALQPHCVLSTWGCNPVSGMHFAVPGSDLLIRGVDADGDSADAFWITEKPHLHATHTRLLASLDCIRGGETKRSNTVSSKKKAQAAREPPLLVLCGASPDGCIENTVASALRLGIRTCAVEKALWLLGTISGLRTLRLEDVC